MIIKKRKKRDLPAKEVFSIDMTNNLHVNEFLSSDTYALLTRTRARAKDLCYEYTWVKAGRIAVRRADKQYARCLDTTTL